MVTVESAQAQIETSRRATISDVAVAAGTSTATVSRVLNGVGGVGPDLVERVQRAAQALSYRKNVAASGLRSGRRSLIGAVVPDLGNPFFTDVLRGVEDTVGPAGYLLLLCNTDGDLSRESAYLEQLAAQHLAGIVIAPASERHTQVRAVLEPGLPVVAVDRRPADRDVHSVVLNNRIGAKRLVESVLERASRVAMIGGPLESTTGHERLTGYRLAIETAGHAGRDDDVRLGPYTQAFGYAAALELLDRPDRPDGLFLGNNTLALGALHAIKELDLSKELGMSRSVLELGFFDPVSWPSDLPGHVACLSAPTYQLGVRAGQILLDDIERGDAVPRHLELDTGSVVLS